MKSLRMSWLALAGITAAAVAPAPAQAYYVQAGVVGAYVERPNLFFSESVWHVDGAFSASASGSRSFGGAYNGASASASLESGEIRISLATSGGTQAALTSRAQASAGFQDSVEFDWSEADGTIQIPWSVRLTGESSVADGIILGTVSAGVGGLSSIFEFVTGALTYDEQFSGLATVQKNQPIDIRMSLDFSIASPDGHTITADFGNTAAFTWTLPPGVTATSQSGVFLSAVPLPAGLWLLLSGLLSLVPALRRRHRGGLAADN